MAAPISGLTFEKTDQFSIIVSRDANKGNDAGSPIRIAPLKGRWFDLVSGEVPTDYKPQGNSADEFIDKMSAAIPEFQEALAKRERNAASAAVINSHPKFALVQEKIADLIETRKEVVEIHNQIRALLPDAIKADLHTLGLQGHAVPSEGFPAKEFVLQHMSQVGSADVVEGLYQQRDALLSTMKDQAAAYFESVRAAFPERKLPAVETNPAGDFTSKATDTVEIDLQHVGFVPHVFGAKSPVVKTCINHLNAALISGKVDHTALPFDVLPPETGHAANVKGRSSSAGAQVG